MWRTATCHVVFGRKPEPRVTRRTVGSLHPSVQSSSTPRPHHPPPPPYPKSPNPSPRPRPRPRQSPINSPWSAARSNPIRRFRSHCRSNSIPRRAAQPESGISTSSGERSSRWLWRWWSGRAHGGGTGRRIGGEGRRLGRRPGGAMGLARHPAAALLRLHLHLLRSRGCFGCCQDAVNHVGELSKSLIAHAQNPTVGEEFWSTTTIEVDPADLRASTVHLSSWDLDQHGVGSSHNAAESANHGFNLWKQTRDEWTDTVRQQPVVKQIQEPVLSWNAAYESLLGSNKPFPQPIPLHEMVDFLVDIWEQEGLYD